ncbi:mRNA interferase, partial [Dysosmobacter welbionis]
AGGKRLSRFPAGPGWSNEILLQLFRDGQELVNLLLRDASGQRRLCGGDPPLCLLIQRLRPECGRDPLHPGVPDPHRALDEALVLQPLQQPGGGGAADAEGALQILLIDFPALAVAEITDQNAL